MNTVLAKLKINFLDMNKTTNIQRVINLVELLIDNNNHLVETYKIIKEQLVDNEDTMEYLRQEYEALRDKANKSIQEECQYLYLCEKLKE